MAGTDSPTVPAVNSPSSPHSDQVTPRSVGSPYTPLPHAAITGEEYIEIAEQEETDVDSTLESGPDSYATSLSPSVTDYQYENGRRYHSYRQGNWLLPNDEAEQDRMDLVHHIWMLKLGGELFKAPISDNPQRILDVGTGTGIWAIDCADYFPSAEVIGSDLSPIQPQWVPPNCRFEIDDAETDWAYSRNSFDLVHVRQLAGGIKDWPRFIAQAFQHIKPGGYIEIQENICKCYSDDNTLPQDSHFSQMIALFDEAMNKIGVNFNIGTEIKGMVEAAGFVGVTESILKFPLGSWPANSVQREVGKYNLANWLEGIESYTMALFTRVLGMEKSEVQVLLAKARVDLKNPQIHMYMPGYVVYARKPLDEEL